MRGIRELSQSRLCYREIELTLKASEEEMESLYEALNDPRTVSLWRGDTLLFHNSQFKEQFEEWRKKEWSSYFFIRHASFGLCGIVYEYARSVENARTKITIVVNADFINRGVGPIALALYVNYLFQTVRLDSVFYEVYGYNQTVIQALRSLTTYIREPVEETVIPAYRHQDGNFWAFHLFRIYRYQWPLIVSKILR